MDNPYTVTDYIKVVLKYAIGYLFIIFLFITCLAFLIGGDMGIIFKMNDWGTYIRLVFVIGAILTTYLIISDVLSMHDEDTINELHRRQKINGIHQGLKVSAYYNDGFGVVRDGDNDMYILITIANTDNKDVEEIVRIMSRNSSDINIEDW